MKPSLRVLYYTTGLVILIQSATTTAQALSTNLQLAVLAGAETAAATLFLLPKTRRIGGTALLVILGLATGLHLIAGDMQWHLLVYIAAIWAVLA